MTDDLEAAISRRRTRPHISLVECDGLGYKSISIGIGMKYTYFAFILIPILHIILPLQLARLWRDDLCFPNLTMERAPDFDDLRIFHEDEYSGADSDTEYAGQKPLHEDIERRGQGEEDETRRTSGDAWRRWRCRVTCWRISPRKNPKREHCFGRTN